MPDGKNARPDWRGNLIEIEPYVPGEQFSSPGLIKLNTNENPFPPSPGSINALRGLDGEDLRRYPDGDGGPLREALGRSLRIGGDNVFVAGGSDEVLAFAFKACFNGRLPIIFPDITYSFYPVWCRLFGIPYREVPLDGGFRIKAEDYGVANGGIVLANPNAPTGISEGLPFLEKILSMNEGSVVIVDEAYAAFGGESAIGLLSRFENLLVVNTFSKSRSLAGMRIGYAAGSRALIDSLRAVKDAFNSYPLSAAAQRAGVACLEDEAYYREKAMEICRLRDKYSARLKGLGFKLTDSSANFLFAAHPEIDAGRLYSWLKDRNILVRWWDKPRIRNHVRITVGREEDMDILISNISEYIERDGRTD